MNGFELLKRDFGGDLSSREHRSRIAARLAVKEAAKSPIVAAVAVFSAAMANAMHVGLLLLAPTLAFALTYWLKRRCARIARLAEAHDDAQSISLPEAVWYSDPGAKEAIRRLVEARQRFSDAMPSRRCSPRAWTSTSWKTRDPWSNEDARVRLAARPALISRIADVVVRPSGQGTRAADQTPGSTGAGRLADRSGISR